MVALYHRIMRRENFEKAAKDLFDLLKTAQTKTPDVERALYVDIDGHKNSEGGYDRDMLELQKDFGVGFLGKYFTEVHFPLIEFKNPNPQCNDIPRYLEIFSPEIKKEEQLDDLYIENYSNTEFVSEPDVFDFLKELHNFLIEYRNYDFNCMICEDNKTAENLHIRQWKNHTYELIHELYNAFIHGNLLTVAAMTRTLIECFVYLSILLEDGNDSLIHEWYLCSLSVSLRDDHERLEKIFKEYCVSNNLDFEQRWNDYHVNPNANRWLKNIVSGKLSFKTICAHLKDDHIYKDFESACAFVHGQDIASKMMPFTFYVSICYRFNMMMLYIFRTIRLFPLSEELENQIADLEDGLIILLEKYYK